MPAVINGGARIRTNTAAENAYNALTNANNSIGTRQLRLSTGKRINSAADDVAGYITSRSLQSRVGSLRSAVLAVGDARNVVLLAGESLDNIADLVTKIKESSSYAASGALGTDEKVALAQAAFRFAQQIQTVVDSTVFGGQSIIKGGFSGDFVIGFRADNSLLTLGIDFTTGAVQSGANEFALDLNSMSRDRDFAGVAGLNLISLGEITSQNLGIFSRQNINHTLQSLSNAIQNIDKLASYIGGIANRLESQDTALQAQITNYNSAISRIADADIALEQLELIRSQFLQQSSVISLAQANQNPQTFLQLLQ